MKNALFISLFLLAACTSPQENKTTTNTDSLNTISDSALVPKAAPLKTYANQRFRNVTAERVSQDTYVIRGQGQIFEASFNWIVEDGHNEIKEGFQMTDAGAPEWGNFECTIVVKKERENSTLTLVLFEASAKDGSRQHELIIPLPSI